MKRKARRKLHNLPGWKKQGKNQSSSLNGSIRTTTT